MYETLHSFIFQGSSNPIEHANWVWENYVKTAKAKKIAVVAHSFGGLCTIELVSFLSPKNHIRCNKQQAIKFTCIF